MNKNIEINDEERTERAVQERLANLTPSQRELFRKKMNDQKQARPANLLVIKEGDTTKRKPLFCLHAPLGITGYYLNIANNLPDDQPVYGIESPALSGEQLAHDDMREMARDYLECMKSVQAEPPYQIIGHSNGAFIAYEIAQILDKEELPLVFAIDQAAPTGEKSPVMDAYSGDDLDDNIQAIYLTCWLVSFAHNVELTFTIEQLSGCVSRDEKYELVSQFLKVAGFLPQSAPISMVSKVLHMIANHFKADAKYIDQFNKALPSKKYDGDLIIFRSTEETNWAGLGFVTPADTTPFSGWEPFCSKPVTVVDIPGSDHINILMEPAVKTLADELEKYLFKSE